MISHNVDHLLGFSGTESQVFISCKPNRQPLHLISVFELSPTIPVMSADSCHHKGLQHQSLLVCIVENSSGGLSLGSVPTLYGAPYVLLQGGCGCSGLVGVMMLLAVTPPQSGRGAVELLSK